MLSISGSLTQSSQNLHKTFQGHSQHCNVFFFPLQHSYYESTYLVRFCKISRISVYIISCTYFIFRPICDKLTIFLIKFYKLGQLLFEAGLKIVCTYYLLYLASKIMSLFFCLRGGLYLVNTWYVLLKQLSLCDTIALYLVESWFPNSPFGPILWLLSHGSVSCCHAVKHWHKRAFNLWTTFAAPISFSIRDRLILLFLVL